MRIPNKIKAKIIKAVFPATRWHYVESAECLDVVGIRRGKIVEAANPHRSRVAYSLRIAFIFPGNYGSFTKFAMPLIRRTYPVAILPPPNAIYDGKKLYEIIGPEPLKLGRIIRIPNKSRKIVEDAIRKFTEEFNA